MTSLSAVFLSAVLWTGSAQVDVMIWEGGGEHPYLTDFELTYREGDRVPVIDSRGRIVGHRLRLIPERIALKARHEVRGLLNCTGTGHEILMQGPSAEIVVRPQHARSGAAVGVEGPPAGSYQLVLPRAIGAFACGTNKRNAGDRAVGIGRGLFHADVEVADPEGRLLEAHGTRMHGSYRWRHNRNYSGQAQHLIRYEFHVTWNIRREASAGPHNDEMQRTKPAQAMELRR
jgi:hypothetical protein